MKWNTYGRIENHDIFAVYIGLGTNGFEACFTFEETEDGKDGDIWYLLSDLWCLCDMSEYPYLCTENNTIALFEDEIEKYIPEDYGYIYSLADIEEYLPEALYKEMDEILNEEVNEIESDFWKFEKELVAKVEKLMEEHELDLDTITVETCHSSTGMYFRLSIEDKNGNTYISKSNFSDCENCAKISFITELLKENSNLYIKDIDWITNYDLRCLCEEDNETTTIEVEYGCPEWIENLFKDTDWNVKITETNDGLEYYFETWSDDGEDLIIEGDAEDWDEIAERIKYEYEDADSDYTYELFWEMRGKNGYPSGRDAIEEAIKSRKESYKELYDVIK